MMKASFHASQSFLVQHNPCEQVTQWFSLVKQLKQSELHTGFFPIHWGLGT
jgi:hypothetical protein